MTPRALKCIDKTIRFLDESSAEFGWDVILIGLSKLAERELDNSLRQLESHGPDPIDWQVKPILDRMQYEHEMALCVMRMSELTMKFKRDNDVN